MNREDFDKITKNLSPDGVKKACYIVREYIRYEKVGRLDLCAVTEEEYKKALSIILAFAYKTSDENTHVDLWYCDSDCTQALGFRNFCQGEFQVDKENGRSLCKYFCDSSDA